MPVIGREGLFRLVGWAERLRTRDPGAGGTSQAVRTRVATVDLLAQLAAADPGRYGEWNPIDLACFLRPYRVLRHSIEFFDGPGGAAGAHPSGVHGRGPQRDGSIRAVLRGRCAAGWLSFGGSR